MFLKHSDAPSVSCENVSALCRRAGLVVCRLDLLDVCLSRLDIYSEALARRRPTNCHRFVPLLIKLL